MSWVGFLAYIVTLVCAVMYLRTSENTWDVLAQTSAGIGTLFCSLAYLTGALWAKFNWGHFFNWDTREISVLVMLLIYAAYFALRSSIENEEQRKRLSSVYAILACIAAGFLMWILPRMLAGLHPGSGGEATAGPMISPQADTLNNTKAFIFSLSLSGFTMIYFWILNLSARVTTIKQRVQPHTV